MSRCRRKKNERPSRHFASPTCLYTVTYASTEVRLWGCVLPRTPTLARIGRSPRQGDVETRRGVPVRIETRLEVHTQTYRAKKTSPSDWITSVLADEERASEEDEETCSEEEDLHIDGHVHRAYTEREADTYTDTNRERRLHVYRERWREIIQ